MTFAEWYNEQFRETLHEPLQSADGMPDSEIDHALDGKTIPPAM